MVDYSRIGDLPKLDLEAPRIGEANDSKSFGNILKRNVASGLSGVGGSAQEVGFENERLTGIGKRMQEEAGPSSINSFSDIVADPVQAVKEGAGSAVASMVPTIAAGSAGAAAGSVFGPIGSAAGGLIGAGSVLIPTYFGNLRQEQKEAGVQKSAKETLGYAALEAVPDLVSGGLASKALPKGVVGNALKKVLTSGDEGFSGNTLTRGLKGLGIGAGVEGIQEGAQRAIERLGANKDISSPEAAEDIGFNAAMGVLGGGALGGPLGAMYKKQGGESKKDLYVPGLEDQKASFTNSDIKNTYQRMQDLFNQRAKDIEAGKDTAEIDKQLDSLKGHLDENYINPPKNDQGVSKSVPETHKQEADQVSKFFSQAKGTKKQDTQTEVKDGIEVSPIESLDTSTLERFKLPKYPVEEFGPEQAGLVEDIEITPPKGYVQDYLDNELKNEHPPEYDVEEIQPASTEGMSVVETPNLLRHGIQSIDYTDSTAKLDAAQRQPTDIGTGKSNLAYKNMAAAKTALSRKGLKESHEVVETSEGLLLRPKQVQEVADQTQEEVAPENVASTAISDTEVINKGTAPSSKETVAENVPENKVKVFHASSGSFENPDFSKSKDLGFHFGDTDTVNNIASKSGKSNIHSATLDTSGFVELPDLDSWNIKDVTSALSSTEWFNNLSDKVKTYLKTSFAKLNQQYGSSLKPGSDMVAASARVNQELRKILSSKTIGLKGIKYINTKEGNGTYSYLVLDPSSISEFKQELQREEVSQAAVAEQEAVDSFKPTHVMETGELVQATDEESVYLDRNGKEWIDTKAKPITQEDVGVADFNIDPENASLSVEEKIKWLKEQQLDTFKNYVESLNKKLGKSVGIEIKYADTPSESNDSLVYYHIQNNAVNASKVGGLFIEGAKDKPAQIWIFGQNKRNLSEIQRTIFHELVGHFGVRKVMGQDWENFLDRLINDSSLATQILRATGTRWKHYLEQNPVSGKDYMTVDGRVVSRTAMRGLADEYIAEVAASLPKQSADESTKFWAKRELSYRQKKSILDRALAAIKHFLRKLGFGQFSEKATYDDIQIAVARSYQSLFGSKPKQLVPRTYEDLLKYSYPSYSVDVDKPTNISSYLSGLGVTTKLLDSISTNQKAKNKSQFIRQQLKAINANVSENKVVELVLDKYGSDDFTWQQFANDVGELLTPLESKVTDDYATTYLERLGWDVMPGRIASDIHFAEHSLEVLEAGFYWNVSATDLTTSADRITNFIKEHLGNRYVLDLENKSVLDLSTKKVTFGPDGIALLYDDLKTIKSNLQKQYSFVQSRIYQLPFKTDKFLTTNHFQHTDNYAGHIREGKRHNITYVVEIQSDLQQSKLMSLPSLKNHVKDHIVTRLEQLLVPLTADEKSISNNKDRISAFNDAISTAEDYAKGNADFGQLELTIQKLDLRYSLSLSDWINIHASELESLSEIPEQWQDLKNHIGKRMIRERIKQAALEGESKIRFIHPGTAALFEGWGYIDGPSASLVVQPQYKGLHNKYKDYQKMLKEEYGAVSKGDSLGNFWLEVNLTNVDGTAPVVAFQIDEGEELTPEAKQDLDWFQLMSKNVGEVSKQRTGRFMDEVKNAYNHMPLANKLSYLGNLPFKKQILPIFRKALGVKTEVERLTADIYSVGKDFNSLQKQKMYEYLTTADADINDYSTIFPKETRDLFEKGKNKVVEMGQLLVDMGKLDKDTFEENKGQYLRTRYGAYLNEYKGSGKSTSFQNYLKKKGDLSEDEKTKLLQIKDPGFLLADTIGTIGRDVGLLEMFETLDQVSAKNNLPWIIGGSSFMKVKGEKKTLQQVRDLLEKQAATLNIQGENLGWGHEQVVVLQQEHAELQRKFDEAYGALEQKIQNFARETNQPNLTAKEYKETYYKQLPVGKLYGKLSGMYVRKEIYDDFKESIDTFFNKDKQKTILDSLETAHRMWKSSKVVYNPAGWVRNAVGNLVLLDIGSPTPLPKLLNSFYGELYSKFVEKKESKYWTLGMENGVFGTTYSAIELYTVQRDFALKLQELKDKERGSGIQAMADHAKDMFLLFNERLNEAYGLVEGSFKVTAIKDHIERWEKENNQKFDDLSGPTREAVVNAAVNHANESIFDYSAVPNWVKTARKFPLGSPFITFTYKAFPQVINSFISNPQKFIKYVSLPFLASAMFSLMNPDLDDKDRDEIIGRMPIWMQDHYSMLLLPKKDSNGKWDVIDFGYFLPWAPFQDAILHVANHFNGNTVGDAATSTIAEVWNIFSGTYGFLGGPLPQVISGLKANEDPFNHQPIYNEGDPAGKQIFDYTRYVWNLSVPSWLSSYGVLGKLYDNITEHNLNKFGTPKDTIGQVLARAVGVNAYSYSPEESNLSNLKYYKMKEQKILEARSTMMKDRNLSTEERALKMREYNERLRIQRNERMDYIKSQRGE